MLIRMSISPNGIERIAQWEALELTAYEDVGGIWTVGYGHTGTSVHAGMTITQQQANAYLQSDLKTAEDGIYKFCARQLNQNQYDALVSLVYNIGVPRFSESTLLKEIHAGNFVAAAAQFPLWDKVKGKVVRGLLNRRIAERDLFLTAVPQQTNAASRG